MTKSEVQSKINTCEANISSKEETIDKLEEKYEALKEFETKCNGKITLFNESMQARKDRLSKLDGMLSKVKSAKKYSDKMNDLLEGKDYTDASQSISELMDTIETQKSIISDEIETARTDLSSLKSQLQSYRIQYYNCKE